MHYLDPHWTYDPPAPFDTMYDPGFKGPWPYSGIAAGDAKQGDVIFRNHMTPQEVRHAIALYEGEIAATEAQIQRLLDGLAAAGRLDDSLVVYTSDHGESLGEHDYFFDHGEYLYDGTLLVPLLLRWPGHVPAGQRRDADGDPHGHRPHRARAAAASPCPAASTGARSRAICPESPTPRRGSA